MEQFRGFRNLKIAEGVPKHIRIEYGSRTFVIPYRSHDEFIKKCKDKFSIGPGDDIIFTIPGDEAEIDSECIADFPSNTVLQLKRTNSCGAVGGSTCLNIARGSKHLQIEYQKQTFLIPYRSHDEFIKKCEDKFKIRSSEMIFTIPGNDIKIDSDCIADFPSDTLLQLKKTDHDEIILECWSDDETNEYELGSADYDDEIRRDIETFQWGDNLAFRKHLSSHKDKNIAVLLEESLQSWRKESVNIAVIGQSGKGKSSLINALRGILDTDTNAAEVGEVETTKVCTPFPHPKYANIVYWDIPGCGTKDFPKYSYLRKINYRLYDFFLIVSTERFHELDIWLADTLINGEKKDRCYFIRSKVDIDMASRIKREKPPVKKKNERHLLQNFKIEVRTAIAKDFRQSMSFTLFLVSSHYPDRYEFQDLQGKLLEDALTEKRLSLAFGMNGLAKPLLELKEKALRSRLWKHATKMSSELSSKTEFERDISRGLIVNLWHEVQFYKEQLSTDDTGLENVARIANTTVEMIKQDIKLESDWSEIEIRRILLDKYKQFRIKGYSIFERFFGLASKKRIAADAIRSFLEEQLQSNLKLTRKLIDHVKARREKDY